MNANSGNHHERNYDTASEVGQGASPASMANPGELAGEIETLEEQIAVLEAGLPQAPGMERAALAKEIAAYRRQLVARRHALRQLDDTDGAPLSDSSGGIA